MRRGLAGLALIVGAALLAGLLIILAYVLHLWDLGNEISLPLLAIVGVVALIGTLALVAIAFALMDMQDKTQALALPNGSVRAVIALSLVVLFGILTVFLFSSLSSAGKVMQVACLNATERDALMHSLPAGEFQFFQESAVTTEGAPCPRPSAAAPAPATASTSAPTAPTSAPSTPTAPRNGSGGSDQGTSAPTKPEPLYKVFFRESNPASEDFAKQLLVLIGTLVTSVAGFYFGAKAVSDAQGAADGGPPSVNGVSPPTVAAGSTADLTITGSNLNDVTHAQLSSGATQITDPSVVTNAGQVKARFPLPADAPQGAWDVIVIDKAGRSARLTGALTVTPATSKPSGNQQTATAAAAADENLDGCETNTSAAEATPDKALPAATGGLA